MNKKSRRGKKLPPLTALELEVMEVVWDLGDCTSAQVTEQFTRKRPLAPTTIRSVLSKLRSKGYVKPIPAVGRGFLMRSTVARETVARGSLKALVSSLFQNSPRQAIAYLLDDANITDGDLAEIRRKLEARQKGGKKR